MSQDPLFFQKRRLLAKILDSDLNQVLIDNPGLTLSQQKVFNTQIKLLESGFPLDYLLRKIDFGDLRISLNSKALIPREETEWWVGLLKARFSSDFKLHQQQILVDLGCGSGIIGLSLSLFFKELWASDIARSNLNLTQKNASLNSLPRPKLILSDLLSSRTFKSLRGKSWILVSNLPYLPSSDKNLATEQRVDFEPEQALYSGVDGLDLLRSLCAQLQTQFQNNLPSEVYLELDPRNIRAAQRILAALYPITAVWTDLNGHERVLVGKIRQ